MISIALKPSSDGFNIDVYYQRKMALSMTSSSTKEITPSTRRHCKVAIHAMRGSITAHSDICRYEAFIKAEDEDKLCATASEQWLCIALEEMNISLRGYSVKCQHHDARQWYLINHHRGGAIPLYQYNRQYYTRASVTRKRAIATILIFISYHGSRADSARISSARKIIINATLTRRSNNAKDDFRKSQ